MIPHIKFTYSWAYDRFFQKYSEKVEPLQKIKYPSKEKISEHIKEIKKLWKENGNTLLRAVREVSGLKWIEENIQIYIVGKTPFNISDPLTIAITPKDRNLFMDILTHELIHRIQSQKDEKTKAAWKRWETYVKNNYGKEDSLTQSHIFLFAVHKEIYIISNREKSLQNEIKRMESYPAYKRSWEIVESEGHKNLIEKFRSLLK